MLERGRLIVIEGSDSSGKEKQSRLLRNALLLRGYGVAFYDFPNYESFFGKLIGRYLRGEFGSVFEVSPFLVSPMYALDRYLKKDQIKKDIDEGKILVFNRYVGSNLAHMSAKLPASERPGFIEWMEQMEYVELGMPLEEISLFLHVPAQKGQELTLKKDAKVYMEGTGRARGDIHESDLYFLEQSVIQYLWLTMNRSHWFEIACMTDQGNLLPAELVHLKVKALLQEREIVDFRMPPIQNIPTVFLG